MARLRGPTAVGVAQLLPYANAIEGAIRSGSNVAGLWQVVRQAIAQGGPEVTGASIFDMNFVAGRARAIIEAQRSYNAATTRGLGQALDSSMWAWAPWSEASTFQIQNPTYVIRYSYDVVDAEGDETSLWGQTDWQGTLSGTVGDIYDRALVSAQQTIINPSPHAQRQISGLSEPRVLDVTGLQILRT